MASMDSEILQHIRGLAEDKDSPQMIEDFEIINLSKVEGRRRRLYYVPLNTNDYLTWFLGDEEGEESFVEVTNLANTSKGDAIDPDYYTVDSIAGTVTFATAQSSVYLDGWQYDVNEIAGWCWLFKAGLVRDCLSKSSLGDESIDESLTVEFCVQQSWRLRSQSCEGGFFERA